MPEGYLHLTCEQRCQIYALLQSGHSQAHIARQIGQLPTNPRASRHGRIVPQIGIGGRLATPPLPHHQAYGSVPWRFESLG